MHRRLLHYEIVESRAKAGWACVQARDTRLDRRVALKILPPGESATGAQKAIHHERRPRATESSEHRHGSRHQSDDGVDLMVMEYIEGQTLDQVIPVSGLRPALASEVCDSIADASPRPMGLASSTAI